MGKSSLHVFCPSVMRGENGLQVITRHTLPQVRQRLFVQVTVLIKNIEEAVTAGFVNSKRIPSKQKPVIYKISGSP